MSEQQTTTTAPATPLVRVLCPNVHCRTLLNVAGELRGRLAKCTHCRTVFRVPEARPAARKQQQQAAT